MTTTLIIEDGRARLVLVADNQFEKRMLGELEDLSFETVGFQGSGFGSKADRMEIVFSSAPVAVAATSPDIHGGQTS